MEFPTISRWLHCFVADSLQTESRVHYIYLVATSSTADARTVRVLLCTACGTDSTDGAGRNSRKDVVNPLSPGCCAFGTMSETKKKKEEDDESTQPPRIKATKKGRLYISTNSYDTDDDRIWAKSPRLKEALRWTGVEWEELVPDERQPKQIIGTTAAELDERRRRAADHQRALLLKQVMDKREEIKLETAVKAAKDAKKAAAGGAEKLDTGPDPAAVLAAAQEHMAKLMEASERRIADDRKRLVEAERIAQEKAAMQRKIDEELEQRKVEQLEVVKKTRAENLKKRLVREEMKDQAEKDAIIDGRKKEEARVKRELEIAAALKEREKKYREKSLQFAHKHAQKLNKIALQHEVKEQRAAQIAAETERKLAESEAIRVARVAELNAKVKMENKLRNEENEKRRLEKKMQDAQALQAKADAITRKLEAVDQRLQASLDESEQKRKEIQQKQVAEEQERRAKLEKMAREKVHAAGEMVGKAEAKDQALERAIKRKEHKLQLRAQESLLTFESKKQSVKRLMKVKEYERLLREEAMVEKDARISEVNRSKKEFKEQRRMLAQQFFVKKAIIKDEMVRLQSSVCLAYSVYAMVVY